jgi:2-polyprenyl-3-methyl-5-hydroxy-6-metoxy-1,4-benzoquinol methylase
MAMTITSKVPNQAEPAQVELVRSFFDQPQNYLERKRFDMRIRAETTKSFLKGTSCARIIDIGCGDGSVSLPLLASDRQLTLLDISSTMLSRARSSVPSSLSGNVEIRQEDFLRAPFENSSYDVVVCMGVLAHVTSPSNVVQKAAALLKPGGTLILECTDSKHFVRRLMALPSAFLALFRPSEYKLNELTSEEVLGMAATHGLELKAMFRYSWPPPGSQRIFSQELLYRMVRGVFGDVDHDRNQWLGFEHIFYLSRP